MNDSPDDLTASPARRVAGPPVAVPRQVAPSRTSFPVVLAVAIAMGLVVLVLFAAGVAFLVKQEMKHARATLDPRAVPLTQRYESENGLI
jgi:hypothetical protein